MAKCNQDGCLCRDSKLGQLDRDVALFWRDVAGRRGAGPTRGNLEFVSLPVEAAVAVAPELEAAAWAGGLPAAPGLTKNASGTCLCLLRCKGRCDNLLTIASRAVCKDCAAGYHAKSEGD